MSSFIACNQCQVKVEVSLAGKLISYGAAVQSLFVPDRKGQLEDIVLGFDDIQGYLGKNPYFGCIVGRVANRIADARFTLNGQSYQLDKNNGPNALHGGLKGLDKVVWNGEINPNTENSVTFSYLSPDGENQYPGNLMINVTYTLTSSNELQIRYLALGDQSTPVNLASHTYYNLGGHASGSESLSSHEVRFNADHMTPVSDKLIPTGEIKPVDGTDFDLRQKQVLGPLIEKTGGYDHNLCLKDYTDIKEEDIKFCGRMEHPLTGRALEVWSNQPGIQFYTDKVLYSKIPVTQNELPDFTKNSVLSLLFARVRKQIQEKGDFLWLLNADLGIQDKPEDDVGFDKRMASDIEPLSQKMAKAMKSLGFKAKDVTHLALPNNTEFFIPVFGTFICQGTVSLGDPDVKSELMRYQLKEAGAKFVFCTASNLERVKEAAQGMDIKIVVVRDHKSHGEGIYSYSKLLEEADDGKNHEEDAYPILDLTARSTIIWSSGTTGQPKGIEQSNKMLVSWLFTTKLPMVTDKIIQTTCFFHGGGFGMPIYAVADGMTSIFFPNHALEERIEKIHEAVHKFKAKSMVGGSHHAIRLANIPKARSDLDLSSLMIMAPMGSNVPEDTQENLVRTFPNIKQMFNFYSMTEFGALVSLSTTPKNLGVVAPRSQVQVINPETQEPLGPNQSGEILAKGPSLMMGYLNRPEETAACFTPEGYIRTGDKGHYDENGILYFDGRLKDLIKFENKHLYPLEIEKVIIKHPGVDDVAVFGKPDPLHQELITAVVVKAPGSDVTEEDIIKMVAENLDDFKHLRGGVIFAESLPRNTFGALVSLSTTPKNLGVVAPRSQVQVINPETQEPLGPNQSGEILAKGPSLMMGYLNRPEETAACFTPEGYIRTGDKGHYDENGILYFDGRLKDLIKFENKHLYPLEIEK
ncbi:hypothetical protein TCAL_12124, partial [Tigriopus californicus]